MLPVNHLFVCSVMRILCAFVLVEYLLISVFDRSQPLYLTTVCTRRYARKPTATFKLWTMLWNSQSLYSYFVNFVTCAHSLWSPMDISKVLFLCVSTTTIVTIFVVVFHWNCIQHGYRIARFELLKLDYSRIIAGLWAGCTSLCLLSVDVPAAKLLTEWEKVGLGMGMREVEHISLISCWLLGAIATLPLEWLCHLEFLY